MLFTLTVAAILRLWALASIDPRGLRNALSAHVGQRTRDENKELGVGNGS